MRTRTTSGTTTAPSAAERVVADLVSAGLLDPLHVHDAESVVSGSLAHLPVPTGTRVPAQRAAVEPAARADTRTLLVEIAGYVGGALVLASMGLFLAREWNDLSETVQVVTLGVVALLLAGAGVLVSRVGGGYAELRAGADEVRRRLTSVLVTAAAVAAAVTVGVQVSHTTEEFSAWPVFAGAVTAAVLVTVGYRYAPSALGPVAMAVSAFIATLNGWDLADVGRGETLWPGLTLLAIGVAWVVVTETTGFFRERVVARGIGSALSLFGAQMPAFEGEANNLAYALMAAVAVAGFLLYLRTVAWPYLVVGVLGVTLVVPEAIIDWTEGSLGVAGGVLVAGLTLLGASLAGLRVKKEAEEGS
jgi:hypothetical protein